MSSINIKYIGVLNVTPDSFSDGGQYLEVDGALRQARALIDEGASLIDVGGDSTRPGSSCVGPEEEWRRIEGVLRALADADIPFAIDTHHAAVAASAVDLGAVMVNDVSAGFDPEMFSVVRDSSRGRAIQYVMMYSRCIPPHQFQPEVEGDIVQAITQFFEKKIEEALAAGISRDQLVLDPGMGKFISDSPERSWEVIRNFSAFSEFGLPLYFGSSRKGFLKLPHERNIAERDYLSAITGKFLMDDLSQLAQCPEVYIRTHNVRLQKEILS